METRIARRVAELWLQALGHLVASVEMHSKDIELCSCMLGAGKAVGGVGLVLGPGAGDHKITARS